MGAADWPTCGGLPNLRWLPLTRGGRKERALLPHQVAFGFETKEKAQLIAHFMTREAAMREREREALQMVQLEEKF